MKKILSFIEIYLIYLFLYVGDKIIFSQYILFFKGHIFNLYIISLNIFFITQFLRMIAKDIEEYISLKDYIFSRIKKEKEKCFLFNLYKRILLDILFIILIDLIFNLIIIRSSIVFLYTIEIALFLMLLTSIYIFLRMIFLDKKYSFFIGLILSYLVIFGKNFLESFTNINYSILIMFILIVLFNTVLLIKFYKNGGEIND